MLIQLTWRWSLQTVLHIFRWDGKTDQNACLTGRGIKVSFFDDHHLEFRKRTVFTNFTQVGFNFHDQLKGDYNNTNNNSPNNDNDNA